jgi:hypothetical protein
MADKKHDDKPAETPKPAAGKGHGPAPKDAGAEKPAAKNPSPTADDGGPPAGNRDDAMEKSLGVRDADMGESGASRKDGSKPAATDKTVPARATGKAPAKAAPALPGDGDVEWEGTIGGDPLHGLPFRFRAGTNEAEAKAAYLRHKGVRNTTGKVSVRRVADGE